MLNMDLVDAFRCLYSRGTSLAWLFPITLQTVSWKLCLGLMGVPRCTERTR
jgi:hypothetical protein